VKVVSESGSLEEKVGLRINGGTTGLKTLPQWRSQPGFRGEE